MGLFDWLMHGLGFEDKEKKPTKTEVAEQDKYNNFNLHVRADENPAPVSNAQTSPMSTFANFGMQNESNLIMVEPKNFKEIQNVVDYLKQGQSVAVNLGGIASEDRSRILDFLSGALYGINGSIQQWQGDFFLLTPEGRKILKPEK